MEIYCNTEHIICISNDLNELHGDPVHCMNKNGLCVLRVLNFNFNFNLQHTLQSLTLQTFITAHKFDFCSHTVLPHSFQMRISALLLESIEKTTRKNKGHKQKWNWLNSGQQVCDVPTLKCNKSMSCFSLNFISVASYRLPYVHESLLLLTCSLSEIDSPFGNECTQIGGELY